MYKNVYSSVIIPDASPGTVSFILYLTRFPHFFDMLVFLAPITTQAFLISCSRIKIYNMTSCKPPQKNVKENNNE